MLNFGNKEFRNLQEQVLKNAQDIEILKEKPNLSISIVDELPEVGQEGILYLVPSSDPELENAYDEYVWLPESESFEMIGTTAIDLSNMVTTDTEQTITGEKTFSSELNVQGDVNIGTDVIAGGKVVIGASGYDIKKDGSNMVIEADGNAIKVRGNLIPNTGDTYGLGTTGAFWNYINVNSINFGNNATISKDSSNRINLNAAGSTRIKVGTVDSTYCIANWTPDTDSTYNLGKDNMRWAAVNAGRIQNKFSSFFIEANGDVNVKCSNNGALVPSSNNLFTLGKAGQKWLTTYTRYISNDEVNIDLNKIATKPDYANPDVWASGKLASGTGSATIDYTEETGVGTPEWGLYMFTYGNAQCYVAFTQSMWLGMLAGYPIRVACPCLKEAGGSVEGNTGNLKIEKTSTTGIIKVTVASTVTGSATSTNGWDFQFIKVM